MKDIVQNIKIKAETDQATKKLDQMKRSMNLIPKLIDINTLKSQKALTDMKTAFVGLTAVAVAAFATIRKGFTGIATLLDAITRFNSALLMTGNTANMSSLSLFKYFNTLLKGLGLSATDLLDVASKFVQAGVSSLSMVRQYTRAAIGLAQQSGQSIETVADKLISAMLGRAGALKLFGINAKLTGSAADALALAINRGAIAFNNIDPNDTGRSLQILKLSWDGLILDITRPLVPGIVKGVRLLADNINAIGTVLTAGSIYIGLKSSLSLIKGISAWVNTIAVGQSTINSALRTQLAALKSMLIFRQAEGLFGKQRAKFMAEAVASGRMQIANEVQKNAVKSIGLKILTNSNVILLATTVLLTTVISNWTKIKLYITGVSLLQRNYNKLIREASNKYIEYSGSVQYTVGQLRDLAGTLKLNNDQIDRKNKLIDTLNNLYGDVLEKKIKYSDSLEDINTKLKNLNETLLVYKQRLIDTAILLGLKPQISKAIELQLKAYDNLTKVYADAALRRIEVDEKTLKPFLDTIKKKLVALDDLIKKQFLLQQKLYKSDLTGTGKGKGETPKPIKMQAPPIVDTSTLLYLKSLLTGALITKNVAAQTLSLKRIIGQLTLEQRNYIINTSDSDKKTIKYSKTIQDMTNDINTYKNKLNELNAVPAGTDPFAGSALLDIQVSPLDERMVLMVERLKNPLLEVQTMMTTAFDNISSSIFGMFDRLGNGFALMIILGKSFGLSMKVIFKDFAKVVIALLTKIIIKMSAMKFLQILLSGFGFAVGGPLGSVAGAALGTSLGNDATSNTNLSYSTGPMISKLDNIVDAINNFNPIQTQVIDLPTLSNANRIGNAMQLQGI